MFKIQPSLARLKRFFNPLCRLQWKLTLSYALVTTVTILLLEALALTLLWYFAFRSQWLPDLLGRDIAEASASLTPYLQRVPADRAGLRRWLEQKDPQSSLAVSIASEEKKPPSVASRNNGLTVVVDREGKIVAAVPANAMPVGASYGGYLPAPAPVFLQKALNGQAAATRLAIRQANGDILLAAPVIDDSSQRVLGAIVTLLPVPDRQLEFFLGAWTGVVLPSVLIIVPATALIGVLFGFVTARGLTRRLQMVTEAATAWGRGDFDQLTRDTSQDELGQLARHLNHMAIQLQHLLETRQELATLEERNRLARDLHDSVKQQVFATAMQVGAAQALLPNDPQAALVHLTESRQLVQQTQQELSHLIHELRPAALEDKGLSVALREHAAEWSRQANIAADLHIQGERPLPLLVEQTIFRVMQEAMANIARHSRATQAELHLAYTEDQVILTISDNGQGFQTNATGKKGIGLQSMRERVEALGGHLNLDSQVGSGTCLTVRLPGT